MYCSHDGVGYDGAIMLIKKSSYYFANVIDEMVMVVVM